MNESVIIDRDINKNYFFCYSFQLSQFLKSQGVGYITVAKDMNTNRVFSLYLRSEQLKDALEQYKKIKN